MKNLVWLSSYPKSGNTWFRVFLTNLQRDGEGPAHINELEKTPIVSSRNLIDDWLPYDSTDLTPDEIDLLRPAVYRQIAKAWGPDLRYLKVHDAYTNTLAGEPLFPQDATFGALYFIRNPLDVCVSFAHHNARSVEDTVKRMADGRQVMVPHVYPQSQVRQKLLSWSDHVTGWADQQEFPVHVVRYEDMKMDPVPVFTEAAKFAGLPHDRERVERALENSSFDVLKKQEAETGFKEKNPQAKSFFRKGVVGSWKEQINPEQEALLIEAHREVMERFGYLEDGKPVF